MAILRTLQSCRKNFRVRELLQTFIIHFVMKLMTKMPSPPSMVRIEKLPALTRQLYFHRGCQKEIFPQKFETNVEQQKYPIWRFLNGAPHLSNFDIRRFRVSFRERTVSKLEEKFTKSYPQLIFSLCLCLRPFVCPCLSLSNFSCLNNMQIPQN